MKLLKTKQIKKLIKKIINYKYKIEILLLLL